MEQLLSKLPEMSTLPYFDDLTSHGTTLSAVWNDTKATLRILANEGIMINIKKCKFLTTRIELLGFVVYNSHYQLGPKSMKKYFELQVPRTLR